MGVFRWENGSVNFSSTVRSHSFHRRSSSNLFVRWVAAFSALSSSFATRRNSTHANDRCKVPETNETVFSKKASNWRKFRKITRTFNVCIWSISVPTVSWSIIVAMVHWMFTSKPDQPNTLWSMQSTGDVNWQMHWVFSIRKRSVTQTINPKWLLTDDCCLWFVLVHRDVKMQNILLKDNYQTLVLTDYGTATQLGKGWMTNNVGTPSRSNADPTECQEIFWRSITKASVWAVALGTIRCFLARLDFYWTKLAHWFSSN